MTQTELFQVLKLTGYPIKNKKHKSVPPLPYITYKYTHSSDRMADNEIYNEINNFDIVLITEDKDLAAEKLLEDTLRANGIKSWAKRDASSESTEVEATIYQIQLIGG